MEVTAINLTPSIVGLAKSKYKKLINNYKD